MAMSSCEWMSRDQARTLVRVLDTCEYPDPGPLLAGVGADRPGLGHRPSCSGRASSLDDARGQFSLRYLYVRAGDGAVMRDHLDRYERWLRRAEGSRTRPERFRALDRPRASGPASPSREAVAL